MALQIIQQGHNTVLKGLENFDIESILECGQCFRWDKNGENDYTGIVKDKVARIVQNGSSAVFHNCSQQDFVDLWYKYFDMETDYKGIIDSISLNDPIMKTAQQELDGRNLVHRME